MLVSAFRSFGKKGEESVSTEFFSINIISNVIAPFRVKSCNTNLICITNGYQL
jgi:hypothetical protein